MPERPPSLAQSVDPDVRGAPFFVLDASPSRRHLDCTRAMPVRYSTWGGSWCLVSWSPQTTIDWGSVSRATRPGVRPPSSSRSRALDGPWCVFIPFRAALSRSSTQYSTFLFSKLPDVVNAAILLLAWSAAASDIYISSRFLFFLSRRGHAPAFLAHLFRYPKVRTVHSTRSNGDSDADADSGSDTDADSDSDSDIGASASLSLTHADRISHAGRTLNNSS